MRSTNKVFGSAWTGPGAMDVVRAIEGSLRVDRGKWTLARAPPPDATFEIRPESCAPSGARPEFEMMAQHSWELFQRRMGRGHSRERPCASRALTATARASSRSIASPWNQLHGVWVASDSRPGPWERPASSVTTSRSEVAEVISDIPWKRPSRRVGLRVLGRLGRRRSGRGHSYYDGSHWSRVKIAGLGKRRPDLTAVWGPSPGHVWIGGQGVILSSEVGREARGASGMRGDAARGGCLRLTIRRPHLPIRDRTRTIAARSTAEARPYGPDGRRPRSAFVHRYGLV